MDEKAECLETDTAFISLFLSKHKSDITFTFPNSEEWVLDPDSKQGQIQNSRSHTYARHVVELPAHKFVLCKHSETFQAMFYGPLADTGDRVRIEDIEPDIMLELLRFVYCGEALLNENNVSHCVYAAKKYDIKGLSEQCVAFLTDNINTENVCCIHEQAVFFELETLRGTCFEFILEHASVVLKTEGFLELTDSTLLELVKDDNLMEEEVDIFKACKNWSENKCRANSLEIKPENIRENLGEIIYQIRFPIMCTHDFSTVVSPTKILSVEEEQEISDYLATTCFTSVNKFTNRERYGRYISVETEDYTRYRNIVIFGCHLSVQIQPSDTDKTILLKCVIGSFVKRVLGIYELQRESQTKLPVKDYKSDLDSIIFLTPIKISQELNLEFKIFEEHYHRDYMGRVTTYIIENYIFLTQRFHCVEVAECVNDVTFVVKQIPTGLTSMIFLKS